jgi:ATP-dependent Clp protease ATP-binding subunit ClpA
VFERFSDAVLQVCDLAYQEAERLRHDYLGPEHILAGLAYASDAGVAPFLRARGLGHDALRAGLDRLVADGTLPGPWRNQADLLRDLGIDIDEVRQAVERSFGQEAVCAALRRARRWSRLRDLPLLSGGPPSPLDGKAMVAKRAFWLAEEEATALGQGLAGPAHLLLGVLRDAEDPAGTGLSRRARRDRAYLGLACQGPSPVRRLVEGAGARLADLRADMLASLHAAA